MEKELAQKAPVAVPPRSSRVRRRSGCRADRAALLHDARAWIRRTRSRGSCGPRPSPARTARSSSSRRTSRFPKSWSHAGDQRRGLRSTSAARRARPSARPACASWWRAWWTPSPAGASRAATSPPRRPRRPSTPSSPTCSCARRWPSTRRSGSTSASRSTRSARRASSTPCDDSMESILTPGQDRGHALQVRLGHRHATSPPSAPSRELLPAAAPRPARSPS